MPQRRKGNYPMTLPTSAWGETKLERMQTALQLLVDWQDDCATIASQSEASIGYTVQMVFNGILRDINVGIDNVKSMIKSEAALNPPAKFNPPPFKINRQRKKFLSRRIMPPGYSGRMVTVKDLMGLNNVSREMIYKYIRTGKIPEPFRFGREVVWRVQDLEKAGMRCPKKWRKA